MSAIGPKRTPAGLRLRHVKLVVASVQKLVVIARVLSEPDQVAIPRYSA
jgi:hypothetical protein